MTYDENEFVTDRERRIARWLAIGMHAAVVVLFVFGVAWQKRHSEPAAVVELWSDPAPRRAEPPPPVPRPEPKPEARPKPEPAPAPPKPEVKAVPKPDIALKEKLEKERKEKEATEKKAAEQKKKEDEAKKLKADAKKKEEALEKERLAKEVEAKRLEKERADIAAKLAKEQAAAQQGAIDKYRRLIEDRIRRNIIEPPNLQGNPEVVYEVRVLPGGDILENSLRLVRSSGNPAYDDAVARAILKSSPLPVPSESALFQQFRDLRLPVRPKP